MPTDAMTDALAAVEDYLRGEVRKCFAEGRDPFGVPWAPLKYRKGRPLVKTGRLQASVTSTITGNGVDFTATAPYAEVHNEGTSFRVPERRRGKGEPPWVFTGRDGKTVFTRRIRAHTVTIPKRTFFAMSPAWVEGVQNVIADALVKRL